MWISKKELEKIHDRITAIDTRYWELDRSTYWRGEDLSKALRELERLKEAHENLLHYWSIVQEYEPGRLVTRSIPVDGFKPVPKK